ncbi:MAG: ATP-binding cassette domain-containing protein [Roseburia sp.]|nr:ATP-binding cassette domain-containing protein [Roseburia sp.]MCM1277850.1 ATP-binding cassette domain-containing protein [Robinsoniella sp.]
MALEGKDITVTFKNGTRAVEHVSFQIEKGIYGLLGENGAGKTTLMRVLTTLIKPQEGTVLLNGVEYKEESYERIRRKIGYLPQELGLYPNLTVRETLEYMGGLAGMSKVWCKEWVDYYLEKTSLSEHQNKKNRQLSGGMKRRVGLIQALLHDPQALIIDEPTTGLDPEERIRIRNLLVDFSRERIVLFSTHVVEDLAATCNQLAIMKKGKMVYEGELRKLIEKAKGHVWLCDGLCEEEAEGLMKEYRVSSRIYTEKGLQLKIISEKKPEVSCVLAEAGLEDAYIYMMG